MNKLQLLKVLLSILLLSFLVTGCQPNVFYHFEGVEGPVSESSLPVPNTTSYKIYSEGGQSRLAILLTDENSNWISLAHGLKSSGIPFLITKDVEKAAQHKMMMVYPSISGRLLSKDALKVLARYPQEGGILLASNVLGGGVNSIFGFEQVVETKDHAYMNFDKGNNVVAPLQNLITGRVKLGSKEDSSGNIGMNSYTNPVNTPLAVYEDGSASITQMSYEDGTAYAIGIDIGQLLARGHTNRQTNISEHYVNAFQPTSDIFLEFIKTLYTQSSPTSITLGTVPEGKSLSVIITHDIDYSKSLINAVEYAEFEDQADIPATYFIQTKYMKDFNDKIFFNDDNVIHLRALQNLNVEIASHSVSHSLKFNSFPLGTGTERYPEYEPFVRSENVTENASIFGELRVSKFLLEHFNDNSAEPVISFRPGFLRNPPQLPETLEATGYKYSSSTTANNALTHLPFKLNVGRGYNTATDIFEFPITIEDDQAPPLHERFDEAMRVARSIEQYGGLYVVLIHTDIIAEKLEFEKKLVAALKPRAWFGSISMFGDWWSARDEVSVDVEKRGSDLLVSLTVPTAMQGLTLLVPERYTLSSTQDGDENLSQDGNKLVLSEASGQIEFTLTME